MIFGKKVRWLSAILLLVVLIVLFIQGNLKYDSNHNQVLHSIDGILQNNANLNSHILMSRSGLLHQYDVVNQDIDNIRTWLKELEKQLDKFPVETSFNLKEIYSKLEKAVDDTEVKVEKFKSTNSLAQNSLMYFSLGSERTIKNESNQTINESSQLISQLTVEILRFLRNPDSGSKQEIRLILEKIQESSFANKQLIQITKHVEIILETLPSLHSLLDDLTQPTIPEIAKELIQQHEIAIEELNMRSTIFRFSSFILSILLVLYLIYLFISNFKHANILSQTNAALAKEKGRAQATLSSIADAVITTDLDCYIQYLNPVAKRMLNTTSDKAIGKKISDLVTLRDLYGRKLKVNPVDLCLNKGDLIKWDEGYTLDDNKGGHYVVELTAAQMTASQDNVIGCALVLRDVSQTRELIDRISHQAIHDDLTGLINRAEFERRLSLAIESARNGNTQHALCYLDLDQFKIVNDTCGHAAGDQLLKQLTHLLHTEVRHSDTLARLGGDEFGILLMECDINKAVQISEQLRYLIQDFRFSWDNRIFDLGVSIGVVAITSQTDDLAQLLSQVDMACYAAKDLGRNRVHVYHQQDSELNRREKELHWASRITHALEENRMSLFGQQIRLVDSDIGSAASKYEILIRLQDDEGKLVSPGAFIPAAERYNLMQSVDRWVIEKVFNLLTSIPDQCTVQFSVNLSGNSISDAQLLPFISEQFKKSNISPNRICFEITETAAILNLTQAIKLIESLKKIGCEFSLDDFGAGLSSFSYLKTLPVDYIKIDGSFIRDMTSDPIDRAMVDSINQVGHIMNKQTIAEFVEDKGTLESLRNLGVDYAQGYLFGKPIPLDAVISNILKG